MDNSLRSLPEMLQFLRAIDELRADVGGLKQYLETVTREHNLPPGVARPLPGLDMSMRSTDGDRLAGILGQHKQLCVQESFVQTLGALDSLVHTFPETSGSREVHRVQDSRISYRSALERLNIVLECLERDIRFRYAFIIAADKESYYWSAAGGPNIAAAFPSAVAELQEAGKCFALERYTATIFHYMRGIERVMRVLLPAVGVPHNPNSPLDTQTWETLIAQFEKSAEEIKNKCQGVRRRNATEFFSGVSAELRFFKDTVRNLTMHTRTPLGSEEDASGTMRRTMDFLARVAKYVSEDNSKQPISDSTFAP